MIYKEFTLKMLEEALSEVEFDGFPKYLGNGLYQMAPGFICGEKFARLLEETIKEEIKKTAAIDTENLWKFLPTNTKPK